jgi:predicted hydrolase (HD superfamily)
VNRDDIRRGAADFGVELGPHIQSIIDALKPQAAELGLVGTGAPAGEDS